MTKETSESLLDLLRERRRLEEEKEAQEKLIPVSLVEGEVYIGPPTKRTARIDMEIELINARISYLQHEFKIAEKRDATKTEKGYKTRPMVWLGTNRQFGETILKLFKDRLILAESDTDALAKAARHFVDKNGKPFKPKNTLQNVRNKQAFTKSL